MPLPLEIPVFPVKQQIGIFYAGVVPAKKLFDICRFDFRRIHDLGGKKEFLGIQRELKSKRIKDIAKYIRTSDAVFPTSVVISVDERCVSLNEQGSCAKLILSEYVDPEDSQLSVPYGSIATIIDGQHRLKSFEHIHDMDFDLPISIFIGVDDAVQAAIFSTVNLAQTKVNKSLVYDLFALDRTRSPEKTCHEIAVALDELESSPFSGRIKRLGTATEGRFGETLSQATIVRGILPYISKDPLIDRDIGKRGGSWPEPSPRDVVRRPFYTFFQRDEDEKILANIINFFSAVAEKWPRAWGSTGRGSVLNKTNGYNGLVRLLRDCYLHQTRSPVVVSKAQFRQILDRVELSDEAFTTERYVPGSTGASKLYRDLVEMTGVGEIV